MFTLLELFLAAVLAVSGAGPSSVNDASSSQDETPSTTTSPAPAPENPPPDTSDTRSVIIDVG